MESDDGDGVGEGLAAALSPSPNLAIAFFIHSLSIALSRADSLVTVPFSRWLQIDWSIDTIPSFLAVWMRLVSWLILPSRASL